MRSDTRRKQIGLFDLSAELHSFLIPVFLFIFKGPTTVFIATKRFSHLLPSSQLLPCVGTLWINFFYHNLIFAGSFLVAAVTQS